jgi:hypothetical protein
VERDAGGGSEGEKSEASDAATRCKILDLSTARTTGHECSPGRAAFSARDFESASS